MEDVTMDNLCPSNIDAAVAVAVESSSTIVEETCCRSARRRRFVDDNVGATTVPVFIVEEEGVVIVDVVEENVGPGVKATTAIVSILTANVANAKSERNSVRFTHFILLLLLISILILF
jgi:hypothetical protein